ncbi:MAG: signal recognition particle-docking protein FtsY [Rickettsiales bacterium]|nr:signal recognition particle-docking protein FtsY [Rickettsiales bacterium]
MQPVTKTSWLARLREGLSRTSSGLSEGIGSIFTKRKLDAEMLEELEELLILADMGASTAARLVAAFGKGRFDKEISAAEVKEALAEQITTMLAPVARPLTIDANAKPHVMLVVGVNGNGKTTTMGKLAHQFTQQGHCVMLAAADTFRAAAVEQLKQWGQRANVPVISAVENADPASVAYRALEEARAAGADILMIDTAGRLHNKKNLMEELQKTIRVLKKLDPDAPHTVLQVLDGTTGQNALLQVETFRNLVDVNGLVVTKLDGTAKGGVVVALADAFKLPIHAIGVGESMEDLREFSAEDFAKSLVGI